MTALLAAGTKTLLAAGAEAARLDAEVLLAHVLRTDRLALLSRDAFAVTPSQRNEFENLIQRRSSAEPIAHIVGFAEFWSLRFKVTADTLIPRADSEAVVDTVLRHFKNDKGGRFVDLGTGCGCLALAILHERSDLTAIALDVSAPALKVAQENAVHLRLAARMETRHAPMGVWLQEDESVDVILSNPPYIHPNQFHSLARDVKDFEPQLALVGGHDGLVFYREIAQKAARHLRPGGAVIVEIGYDQSAAVQALFKPYFMAVECIQDLTGNDRVIYARAPA